MSAKEPAKSIEMPVECPDCGKLFDETTYPEITIPGDNKLKKKILRKEMFYATCPYCGKEFKLKANCLYRNDIKREAYIVTDSDETAFEAFLMTGDITLNNVRTEEDAKNFAGSLYKRRVVRNVDAFREKILLSDSNYDDRIMELMKLSLSRILEKENHMPVYRICLDDASGNMLEFVAFLGAFPPFDSVSVSAQAAVYNYYHDKYFDKLGKPEADEYISTDQEWAKNSGLLADEDAGFVIPL